MEKQERVLCAAVKICVVKEDYKGAKVFTGVSYEEIYSNGILSYIAHPNHCNIFQNGFLTSNNRFVDPIEAQKIAIAAGQYDCPNKKIARLEDAIETRRFELEHTKSNMAFNRLQGHNQRDRKNIRDLKDGYLGYELRVGDLY